MQCSLPLTRAAAALLAAMLAWNAGLHGQDPVVLPPAAATSFETWVAALREEAAARGVSRKTIDEALGSVEPLGVVIERDRTQAELTLTIDQYLKRRLTRAFVRTARQAARKQRSVLQRVEHQYGVPDHVVTAIWGLESHFGRFAGIRPTIPTLATLAFEGRRAALFREELFSALTILDKGLASPAQLKGSWAGALGQPQFMPSTFLTDAVDFDGDGRRDIWTSTPDVLASIAHYLQARGWVSGERWGREVRLSDAVAARVAAAVPLRLAGSCSATRQMTERRSLDVWKTLGVRLKTGGSLPAGPMEASLARVDQRVFLVYRNYEVLLAYNCAHTYALSVAMLADQIG